MAAPDAEALAEALDLIGEPGATSLTEVFDGRTAERQAVAITARAHLQTDRREIRARLAGLRAERDTIAAEQDDAPPANDLRPPAGTGARVPRSGGWSGSPTGSTTPRPPPSRVRCTGRGC